MEKVGLVEKGVGANGIQEGSGPSGSAVHAVWILDRRAHIGLHALNAGLLVTLAAFGLLAHNRCIGFSANRTCRNFHDFIPGLLLFLGLRNIRDKCGGYS